VGCLDRLAAMSGERPAAGYVFPVWPVNEARAHLPEILDRFAEEGALSPPIIVGRHRKPEAALVPYRLLARLLAVYEAQQGPQLLADEVAERADAPVDDFVDVDVL
jgi:antitoxin StbD